MNALPSRKSPLLPRFCCLSVAVLHALCLALPFRAQSAAIEDQLRLLVDQARPSLATPGLSVAVGRSNVLVWSGGFGEADLERHVPVTPTTVFRYASISKPIAATAVMQCVERGQLSLDDPIQRSLPDFPVKPEGAVTLRLILTHTSGIRHYKGNEFASNHPYTSVEEALVLFKEDPLEFVPGTKYQYSSHAYNITAAAVERVSHENYRAYLRTHIFMPSGMTSTDLEFLAEPNTNRCVQYVATGDGFSPAPAVDLSCKWAGGGMAGTAEDLVRFCQALDRGALLKPEILALMYKPGRLLDGEATQYGLGWSLSETGNGQLRVGHSGGAMGGTTYLLHQPGRQVAVAILSNAQNVKGLAELAAQLMELILNP